MKQHRYRITVEHLADAQGDPSAYDQPLCFEVGNHDDIFAIVERSRGRADLDESSATALAVGLKLFGEVMLEHRDHPLFQAFAPHFRDFMKTLKKGGDDH
ncbi:DUF3861 domain-containing protein [Stutzerimonas kirkiae]|uniref:DUF3861 domain-containing protein n=1 Tax=Stutzerimonas kirkiae TaxID=2211392 RepID=UPI0010384933|nr:DUF3861 domain-containing protein [Stutzerimonas kirkiae]TBV12925.1 DUF3861 domain-containing protein [Stutzerimonas kirkiae]